MAQDINGTLTHTIQSQVTSDLLVDNSLGIMPLLVRAGELLPAYWSRARDAELSRLWMREDHTASAFSMFVSKTASIPLRIIPRDQSIKAHVKQADDLTANINELSDWGKGWSASFIIKMIMSFITQDNGCFAEVLGDAPRVFDPVTKKWFRDYSKERIGFYGLSSLDPALCQRTSNPLYPVIYSDIGIGGTGNRYKMHHTRVIEASSLPNYLRPMNNVGFSAMSRLIHTAQHLLDMATTEQEELGSRPKRRLIIGKKGITANEIVSAFQQADMQMDSQGLSRYSKSVVIASTTKPTANNEIEIDVQDLASVLKGEDKERSITLGMFLIALALNIPPRWLWPATSTGATKADAMYQHIAGMGGGIGHLLQVFTNMLGGGKLADVLGKPIPSHLQVVFDEQDDEQDRQQAEVREIRSKVWTANLNAGILDERTAREQMLDAGDITEQQFDDMELADGRLPDGQDILNLFLTTEPALQEMLSISVGDVLNIKENDAETVLDAIEDKLLEVRAILVNPIRPKVFDQAKQAFAALMALKELYEGAQVQQQIEEGMMDNAVDEVPPDDEMTQQPQPPSTEVVPPVKPTENPMDVNKMIKDGLQQIRDEVNHRGLPQQPDIHIHLPIIDIPPIELNPNITFPEQKAPIVNVTVPKQSAPIVHVKAPIVNVPEIKLPAQEKQAPPIINIPAPIVTVNVPKQDAPTVNVTPNITVKVPEVEEETSTVERDSNGFIKLVKKLRIYKK